MKSAKLTRLHLLGSAAQGLSGKCYRFFGLVVFVSCVSGNSSAEQSGSRILRLATPPSGVYTEIMKGGIDNGIFLSGGGALISYCPLLACVQSPSPDHQRAAALFMSTSRDDSHSEEQTVAVETVVKTGFQRHWSPNTTFGKGENIVQPKQNAIYRATTSGLSAASGDGPRGKTDDILDGTIHWQWINDAAIGAKVGLYNELVAMSGAGAVWGQANNVHLSRGMTPTFAANTEYDFGNEAKPCILGQQQCYNLFLETNGFINTASMYIATTNTEYPASYFGILLAGDKLASSVDIEDDASAAIGLGICADKIRKCTHSDADIVDAAGGAVALKILGDHTIATIADLSNVPTFASIGGQKSLASIYDHSLAPVGLYLAGTYREEQIKGNGWLVDPSGRVFARAFQAPLSLPKSSHHACNPGEFVNSQDYYYVCTSLNHWKRVALSDF